MTIQARLSSYILPIMILLFFNSPSSAQTPVQAPGPSSPADINAILQKGGQFTTFIKLLKGTQVSNQINTQISSSSNQGMTVFAPTDNAFSNLKAGTLNSLSSDQQLKLVQFHVLPTFYSVSQFQTASNPLHTQAGNSDAGEYPLNVTTSGNQVNVSTGVDTAPVSNTIYSDGQLAVYQVDQVLLPLELFGSSAPAPAPTNEPEKRKVKGSEEAESPSGSPNGTNTDASAAFGLNYHVVKVVFNGVAILGAFLF